MSVRGVKRVKSPVSLAERQYSLAVRIERQQELFLIVSSNWMAIRHRIQLRRGSHGHRVEIV